MKPDVSVIVAIYNVGQYLEQCIESIISQTFPNIEIILVDDGSTDDSAAICDRFAAADSRINVIHQPNSGVSAARNTGIDAATADWIMFVDGDDWLPADSIENLLDIVKGNDDCDVVIGSYYRNYPKIEEFVGGRAEKGKRYEYDLSVCRKEILSYELEEVDVPELSEMKANLSSPWAKLFRKELLDRYGISYVYGQKRAGDEIFNLYVFQYSRKIIVVSTPVYHYRIWEGSICRQVASNKIELDIFSVWNNEVISFLNQFDYCETLRDAYNLFAYRRINEIAVMYMGDYCARICSYSDVVKAVERAINTIHFPNRQIGNSKYFSEKQKIIYTLLKRRDYFALRFIWVIKVCRKRMQIARKGSLKLVRIGRIK